MLGTENFKWKDKKLLLNNKDTGFGVILSEVQFPNEPPMEDSYYEMFRVFYPNGKVSKDYYNLTRAKNHCISEASLHFNNAENAP